MILVSYFIAIRENKINVFSTRKVQVGDKHRHHFRLYWTNFLNIRVRVVIQTSENQDK